MRQKQNTDKEKLKKEKLERWREIVEEIQKNNLVTHNHLTKKKAQKKILINDTKNSIVTSKEQDDNTGNGLFIFSFFCLFIGILILMNGSDSLNATLVGYLFIMAFPIIIGYGTITNKIKTAPKPPSMTQAEIRSVLFGASCPHCFEQMVDRYQKNGRIYSHKVRYHEITPSGRKISIHSDAYYCPKCKTKIRKDKLFR